MFAAWHRKAVWNGLKSLLPFRGALRRLKRSFLPYETIASNDTGLLQDVIEQVQALTDQGIPIEGADVVELGTGWNPILPMVFALCGARSVTTLDQERLLDPSTLRTAISQILENRALLTPLLGGRAAAQFSRLETLRQAPFDKALQALHIDYRAPYDFLHLPAASADIVVSRDVLEHVPEGALTAITAHSHAILRAGGTACHTVDMSDHWEHADKSISRVNFLQFDGPLWRLAGLDPQNFQNRLRRQEYAALFTQAGFDILTATGVPDTAALRALAGMRLCARYRDFPREELAVLSTRIIARKPAPADAAPAFDRAPVAA